MTEHTSFSNDDEALSALIDGTLPSEDAAALRGRMNREPALAARFAAMERANRAVREAYRSVVDEPLPQRTLDLLRSPQARGDNVVALALRRASPSWFPHALAAGVALAVGLGLGFGAGQRASEPAGLLAASGSVDVGSPLYELLETVPSGEQHALGGTATAEARLTFRTIDGDWCREVAVRSGAASNSALACRRGDDWRIELLGVAPAGGELYRPAGGDAPFQEAVDALIDGEALEPAAERAVLESGWPRD